MAEDTWLETFETWYEHASEYLYGPTPTETIRRANANIRTAVLKLDRERKKAFAHEQQLFANTRSLEKSARSFADLRPGLVAIANARRSGARINMLVLKMRSLQQQLIETEAQNTTSQVGAPPLRPRLVLTRHATLAAGYAQCHVRVGPGERHDGRAVRRAPHAPQL
jgi:hypothetical protein